MVTFFMKYKISLFSSGVCTYKALLVFISKDVQLTAANDDQYFVFEDSLYQVLLCFNRDTFLLELFDRSNKKPMTALSKGTIKGQDVVVIYPPNGIVPFHGFAMYGKINIGTHCKN